jgi:hypothetical protein
METAGEDNIEDTTNNALDEEIKPLLDKISSIGERTGENGSNGQHLL